MISRCKQAHPSESCSSAASKLSQSSSAASSSPSSLPALVGFFLRRMLTSSGKKLMYSIVPSFVRITAVRSASRSLVLMQNPLIFNSLWKLAGDTKPLYLSVSFEVSFTWKTLKKYFSRSLEATSHNDDFKISRCKQAHGQLISLEATRLPH